MALVLGVWVALSAWPCAARGREPSIRSYGPISVGRPNAGFLIGGQRMPRGKDWVLTQPAHTYATGETIEQLTHCFQRVRAELPGAPKVRLGSLSAKGGGKIAPHDSHRTGRDADVAFFRQPGARWGEAATEQDIDLPLTWALLRCFLTDTDVDLVLIDAAVMGWLESYARSLGEPSRWLDGLFHDVPPSAGVRAHRALIRHAPGHVAHMHVRFVSPKARRLGVQLYDRLVREGLVKPPHAGRRHRVVSGDTLSHIARRYHVSVQVLRKQNGLKSTRIRPGQSLIIQVAVPVPGAKDAVQVPPRRLPPPS
ncbi:MAG TPA: penicillin-insensitive murein endopeptidase [Polyangiaceae bacterium]|nr:penicillin-insensitive murein endopeptidase [Polyangiaceae bacterium]